jgi:ubiquinone/menaquinone biosynthesis C-methylase UbiE
MIDIEDQFTQRERAAAEFILGLRRQWATVMYPALVGEYERAAESVASPSEVRDAVHALPSYPWFSYMERLQQKMLWRLAADVILKRRDDLLDQLPERERPDGVASLKLDPDLTLPSWYTDYDIHMQPGGVYSDILSAYVYQFGARIVMLRQNDNLRFHRLFVDSALPDVKAATRVVDVGCGFGKSTQPLASRYEGAEVIGIDLAAPVLRLAYALAEEAGAAIRYLQADARSTPLEAGSCDIVTGTMVLHEMPEQAIIDTVAEASRLLKPGGHLRFLEFQLTGDPMRDVTIEEHAERNNEPYFHSLFASDLPAICRAFGIRDARWQAFDERSGGVSSSGWGERPEWHLPWSVLSGTKEGQ